MSVTYFITAVDPRAWEDPEDHSEKPTSDLFIDSSEYREQVLKRWPDAELYSPPDSLMLLTWNLYVTGMLGHLHNDHQTVALKPGRGLVELILWHRAFVPAERILFLFADSSFEHLDL